MKKSIFIFAASLFTISGFISCSSDKDEVTENYSIDPSQTTINYDKTQQLTAKNNGSSIAATEFSWKTSDDKRGTVNAQGLFTAKKVGEVEVTATKNGKTSTAKIIIAPYQNFFKEPLMYFGKTKADIKAAESRTLQNETPTALAYKGENSNVTNVGYTFDANGKMNSAIVIFPSTTASVNMVSTFYKERYNVLTTDNNIIYLKSLDQPILMGMGVNATLGLNVIYTQQ